MATAVAKKSETSLRLRAFPPSSKPRSNGNHDVARFSWTVLEKIQASGVDTTAMFKKLEEAWVRVKQYPVISGDADTALDSFVQWQEGGFLPSVLALAQVCGSLAGAGDACAEVVAWFSQLREALAATLEKYAASEFGTTRVQAVPHPTKPSLLSTQPRSLNLTRPLLFFVKLTNRNR